MTNQHSFYHIFEKEATIHKDNIALIVGDRSVTYGQLMHDVNQIAQNILQQAYQEQFIGISTTKSVNMITGLLAILKAGKTYLPLDPEYPAERLTQLTNTARLKFILCLNNEEKLFGGLGLTPIDTNINTGSPDIEVPFYSPIVCVLFTSGSTGVPKGVCLGYKGLANQLNWQKQNGMAKPGVRTLQYSHLSFDAAFLEIFVPLVTGGTLYLIDDSIRLNAGNLLHFIIEHKIERVFLAYAVVQFLAEIAQVHNKYPVLLKEIITGGELLRITPAITAFFDVLQDCTFMNVYGPTETSVWVTELKLKGNSKSWPAIPSLGKTIDGAHIFITDRSLKQVAPGETGEVLIYGDCVALGYLNNPELTAERFIDWDHPKMGKIPVYRTGDLASLNEGGTYQFRGRDDNQVKIRGGHRVELSEIEVVIAAITGVSQVKVIVREDIEGDRRIVAYVILSAKEITEKEIKQVTADKLPDYMLPDRVVIMDQFPVTVSGKIDSRSLPAPERVADSSERHVAPENPRQEYLKHIWEELLQVEDISITDDFFELGGNSLAAIKLMIKIEKEVGKQLPLVSVYQFPTVEKMAALIDSDNNTGEFSPLVPLKSTGNKPPVYLIHGDNLNVLTFRGIAQHIDKEQPVYGLQPKGIDGQTEPLTTIEAIAEYYNKAILLQNPAGPYAIVGYSFGGYVALEMAKQLQQKGKEVFMLGMLDCDAYFAEKDPDRAKYIFRKILRQFPKMLWIGKTLIAHPGKVIKYQWTVTKERINETFHINKNPDPSTESFIKLMDKINAVHHKAIHKYQLEKFPGKIALFKAMERPYFVDDFEYLGWNKYATGIEVHNIPGDHSTMLDEPNCKVLAAELDKALIRKGK